MRTIRLGAWLFALVGLATAAAAQETSEAVLLRAPVVVDGQVLAQVRGIAGRPAEERAAAIEERIVAAARDSSLDPSKVHVEESDDVSRIQAGDMLLMGVFDADAALERMDRQALAQVQARVIHDAIERYRADRTPEKLVAATEWALIATAIFVAGLIIVFFLTNRVARWMTASLRPKVLAMRSHALGFLPGDQVWESISATARALRFVLVALMSYMYAQYTLTLFPSTRPIGMRLASYLLDPLRTLGRQFVDELPALMFLLVIFILTRFVLRLLKFSFAAIGSGAVHVSGFEPQWAAPTYRLVRVAVVAFALVIAYPHIPGSESEAFKGLSIFAGVLFSIGSSSFIANYMAGYTLIYRRLFSVGDRVKIGDIVGEVLEVRVQVTRLRTYKNEEVIVPNSSILTSEVTNFTSLAGKRGLILHTSVGIGYEVPWRQVEGMLLTAAERTQGVLKDPKPFVLQTELGGFAVTYEINAFVGTTQDVAGRYNELHGHILDVFNEHGVQIMTPAYEGDPSEPKVVPRARWHESPSRRTDE
jgi:small-conductance mechanosensitive channel